jgi:hypothetical protein
MGNLKRHIQRWHPEMAKELAEMEEKQNNQSKKPGVFYENLRLTIIFKN